MHRVRAPIRSTFRDPALEEFRFTNVLVVADASYDERLAPALAEAGLHVVRQAPGDLPLHPAGFIGTDSVVLQLPEHLLPHLPQLSERKTKLG